jgi:hypothetical protein
MYRSHHVSDMLTTPIDAHQFATKIFQLYMLSTRDDIKTRVAFS